MESARFLSADERLAGLGCLHRVHQVRSLLLHMQAPTPGAKRKATHGWRGHQRRHAKSGLVYGDRSSHQARIQRGQARRCAVLSVQSALAERVAESDTQGWPACTQVADHVRPFQSWVDWPRGAGTSREAGAASGLAPRQSRPAAHKPDPSAAALRRHLRAGPRP